MGRRVYGIGGVESRHEGAERDVQFSELALFRLAGALELLISLVDEGTEGFQIVSDFSHPFNLRLLVQISVDSSA